ncbi:zincin-like metallopeptidase domain-containing protein [Treponema socranskii]|uniref:zincin-like metallopeptidase domain-containing protein n=1 Tax=Treponema socranskii TaxID=53419 RepID=UPI003D9433D0
MLQKEALLRQITNTFNLSPDEAEAALLLLDTRAANLDMSLADYMQTYHPAGFSQKGTTLNDDYKGYVQFLAQDAKAIITTGETADFSTFVHENAHIFRRQLAGDLKAKAERAFKVEDGNWTREQEEYFAIGFEEYIRLRMAESEDLRQVFERGARCMQHIYNGLDRIVTLNPEIIKVYDELFTESRFRFNQKRFEKTVKDINENNLEKFKASHVYLGMTPPIYQEIGFERLPVMITAKHLKNVMQDWGSDANVNYHGLTPDIIAQIPEAIKRPLIIMQSQNKEHPEDIIAVVELKDKDNKPIIIPFSPNKKGRDINNFQIDINLAKSIYGRSNFEKFLENAFKEKRILFINGKSQVLASPQVQYPSNQGSQLFYDNIARYREIVKQKTPDFAKLYQNTMLFQRSSYYSRETQKEKRAEDVNKIAGYFIKAIETNTAPWMKPWKANEYIDDFNPVTKTTYRGINSVILPFIRETEFHSSDPRWYTFNNAKEQNFMVKKGEKATPIVFYGTVPIGKDGKALAVDEEGNPIGEAVRFRSTLRFYKVFHASQLGVPQFDKDGNLLRDETGAVISIPIEPFEQPKIEAIDFKPIASAEKVLQQSGARIYHDQSDKSFYTPVNDSIHLCPKENYINETLYYGTALHELVHWTGAESRLNRDLKNYSVSETARAREELIAEIGSYALCKDLKLDFNPQNSAAYVQSWCEILRDKPDEIMKATHAALEAKEYIQGSEHRLERVQSIRNNVQGENNMERGIQTNGRKSVHEVGKEIWSLTNFSEGNIYGNDFETWYRECFPYTIHKAADNATEKILKGDRRYKDGSFIEMEAWEAKDGKPHTFFFDKEHFAEYYDERQKKQAELQSAPRFFQEEAPTKKQTEFDFSGKELPCYNPTSGKLYQAQEFEEHLKAINSDDKRYLSQSDIIKFGFTIKSNARPILLKTEKIVTGNKKNNYELLYNGKDIVGLPPATGKEKTSVHQPVRSITVQREKDYGMEIG